MFDENQDNQPEDIFADVDGVSEPPTRTPFQPSAPADSVKSVNSARSVDSVGSVNSVRPVNPESGSDDPLEEIEEPTEDLTDFNHPPAKSKIRTIAVTVIVMLGIGALAWAGWSFWQRSGDEVIYVLPEGEIEKKRDGEIEETNPSTRRFQQAEPSRSGPSGTEKKVKVDVEKDTDGDGLTDAEEEEIGTDRRKPDTDSDGLSDKDEVEIYQTNPVNPDTDKDGILDGIEVRRGDDPNGPGRLLELPVIE